MRNIRLVLSYDGTDFSGWQTQPGFRTVQETLETALAALGGRPVRVNASGRTDAGVHAVGQVVNFYADLKIPTDKLVKAINAFLPPDVVVRSADDVPQAFDANRDARRKLYRYVIHDGPTCRRCSCAATAATPAAAGRGGDGAGGGAAARPARLPQLRDGLAQPHVERADDHAPGGQPRSATGSGWMWRRTASCTIWCGRSPAR